MTARIRASPYSTEFSLDQGLRRRFHDRNHEAREGIPGWYEAANVSSAEPRIDASGPGTAAQHSIDLNDCILSHARQLCPAFRQGAQGSPYPTGIHQRGRCCCRLQNGAAQNANASFVVNGRVLLQPTEQGVEVAQQISAR